MKMTHQESNLVWECSQCGESREPLRSATKNERPCIQCNLQRTFGPDYRSKKKAELDAMEGGKMVAAMSVEHVAGGIYKVGSASTSRVYTVDVDESTCTCTNWAIQRNRLVGAAERAGKSGKITYACKHIKEVTGGAGVKVQTAKKSKEKSKEEAKKKVDSIVAKFTTPGTRDRAIETLRDAARLKKE